MDDLIENRNLVERLELARPPQVYLLWVLGSVPIETLEKFRASVGALVDADIRPTWTLIRFDAPVGVGIVKVHVGEFKYILQLNEKATVLSSNFNMEPHQIKRMREFLHETRSKLLPSQTL